VPLRGDDAVLILDDPTTTADSDAPIATAKATVGTTANKYHQLTRPANISATSDSIAAAATPAATYTITLLTLRRRSSRSSGSRASKLTKASVAANTLFITAVRPSSSSRPSNSACRSRNTPCRRRTSAPSA
jgi:hypothetical protein